MLRPLLVALLVLLASSASAAPVIAVLYFDNHSADARFDVLRKGLADMLVTDISTLGVTVVERERLQAVLAEHALQATTFIDDKTAVASGLGLGATHVLTGSLVAVTPKLRIDARLIDVATGKVVAASKVSGASDDVFALEQELVAKLAKAMSLTFAAAPLPTTKVKDLPTLEDYSKAIDLADRGEVEPAKKALDALVSKSPAFGLARAKRDALVARLATAIDRRAQSRVDAEDEIIRRANAPDASMKVRLLKGCVMLRRLAPFLSEANLPTWLPGNRAVVEKAELAWVAHQRELIAAIDVVAAKDAAALDRYDAAETSLAQDADFDRTDPSPIQARLALARWLLVGDSWECNVDIAPPLARSRPDLAKLAETTLAEAAKIADERARTMVPYEAYQVRELWGEYYWDLGDTEKAVAKWQEALDLYPKAAQFERLERRIKKVLGLEHDAYVRDRVTWHRGLTTCLDSDLRPAMDNAFDRAFQASGVDGFDALFEAVHQACDRSNIVQHFWEYLATHTALAFGRHHYCERFEHYAAKSLAAGGARSELDAYRKNFTTCPAP